MAKVNGVVWDLDRPFESDAELKLLKFDDPEGMVNRWADRRLAITVSR